MSSSTWTLELLESMREGTDFEAKRAGGKDGMGQLPEDFWPTYSAMANTQGGTIVLGMREHKDGHLEVVGLSNPEHILRELWNLLRNPQKVSANVLQEKDVEVVELEGRSILVIQVPRAPRELRPIYLKGAWETETYLRLHEGDRRIEKDQVRRMIADAEYVSRDDRILEGSTLKDLHMDTLKIWRNLLSSRELDHPWLGLSDAQLLQQLGGWRVDRGTGQEGLTLAGLLMFGRGEVIQEFLPHYFVDYQERESSVQPSRQWLDRVCPDGRWSGNLLDFYQRVIHKLMAGVRVPFALDAELYRVDQTKVHRALREALVNCLIHGDYEGRVGVLVEKFPGSFRFRNPGMLRLPLEQIRKGGVSDCRNRTLQKMFRLIGLGEQAGSGFSRILEAWREQHWLGPALEENAELETTTLRLSMESLLPEQVVHELTSRFGTRFRELSAEGRSALVLAQVEGEVSHARLMETTDLHARDITLLLQSLVAKGLLERHGERRKATYGLVDTEGHGEQRKLFSVAFPIQMDSQGTGNSSQSAESSSQSSVNSSQSAESSSQSAESSSQSSVNSSQSSVNSSQSFNKPITLQIAEGKWASQAKIKRAILEFCQQEFRTVHEIASVLQRKPKTIQKNYIVPMVREKLLIRQFPEQSNHPKQAYKKRAS
jgi:predicted HTH transcriptional regulator